MPLATLSDQLSLSPIPGSHAMLAMRRPVTTGYFVNFQFMHLLEPSYIHISLELISDTRTQKLLCI